MKNVRQFLSSVFIFFSVLVTSALFVSCEADSDFSEDLKRDFNSVYTFYSYEPDSVENFSSIQISFPIGKILSASDLPSPLNPDIAAMNEGYTFKNGGWLYLKNPLTGSSERPETIQVDANNLVTQILVTSEYANFVVNEWEPIEYSVILHGNGGVDSFGNAEQTQGPFLYDEEYTLNTNPFDRGENYIFNGWGTLASQLATSPSYFDGQTVKNLTKKDGDEINLYALWLRDKITITFNANGGSGEMATMKASVGDALTLNSFTPPQGKKFINWQFTDSFGIPWFYYDGETFTDSKYPNEDATFYAQWDWIFYTLILNSNDGNYQTYSQWLQWGEEQELMANPFTRTGYDFTGWNSEASGTGEISYSDSQKISITSGEETQNIYAQWSEQSITVQFHENGGTGTLASQTIKYSELPKKLSANTFTREGYNYIGWNTSADGNKNYFYDGFDVTEDNWNSLRNYASGAVTIDLYAQWDVIRYSVKFDTTGGTWTDSYSLQYQYLVHDTQATKPSDPTRTAYEFVGWYESDDWGATFASSAFDFSTPITKDTWLYAQWNAQNLTITFDANGGTGSMAPQTLTGDDLYVASLSPNSFTRTGYNFVGWSTSSSATSTNFVDGELITESNWNTLRTAEEITLYAVWEIQTFTVDFIDSLNFTLLGSQTVNYDTSASRPADPSKTGYEFKGWYTDSTCTTEFDFETKITAYTAVYAKWQAETLTIHFDANGADSGSTTDQTVVFDALPQFLSANEFAKTGYDFTGWNTSADGSGTAYYYDTTIRESNWTSLRTAATITLYAQWKIQTFTVSFIDAIDSTEISSETVEYGSTILVPSENPTKAHYTFLGWDNSNTNPTSMESAANFATPVTSNVTIWAKWTPDIYTVTFDGNGATSGAMGTQIFTYDVPDMLIKSTYEKSGYLFGGWAISSTATSPNYGDEATISVSSDMTLYAVWTQRGSISRENGLVAQLDEENEQIIFTAGGDYTTYNWTIDGVAYGSGESIIVPYDSSYANGSNHFVLLIGTDANGEFTAESANFKILPKN